MLTKILLADDDKDDCSLFAEALQELRSAASLSVVHNGEELMHWLLNAAKPPSLLFLDLNIPRKNGMECLAEIRKHKSLAAMPVIICSTSFEPKVVSLVYDNGAYYYIRKPADFERLKDAIAQVIHLSEQYPGIRPEKEYFVIQHK
jgi:DNA-binding NtrC family response regulator